MKTRSKSTGTEICLSIWEDQQTSPVVVFIPGTMSYPLFYGDFLEQLSGEGFNVIGVHLISHGKSPRQRKSFSFDDMKQNVKDAVSYCQETYNGKVILMGSSQGGILALAVGAEDHRMAAVFPHNVMLPELPETISVTSFPRFLWHFKKPLLGLMKLGAAICPRLPIPITFYLDVNKITTSQAVLSNVYSDKLILHTYPLCFLVSLLTVDMSKVTGGGIQCPVIVIASTGDTLFSLEYIKLVFDKIKAPTKELLTFDLPCHLLFIECVSEVVKPIASKLKGLPKN